MASMMKRNLYQWLEFLFIAGGAVFAWSTIVRQFMDFYAVEGTVFKIAQCQTPNPVTTMCFYGGLGFLVALVWSILLLRRQSTVTRSQRIHLVWFLVLGTLFAWSVVSYEWWQIQQAAGQPVPGCSGLMTSILDSPCFYGANAFLLALLSGWLLELGHNHEA